MKINALIVEDDIDLAEAISDYMTLDGIEFDFAYNGLSAINLVSCNAYDVILTDLNMPKMNGIDLCLALRNQGINIPILMLTARDTLDDKIIGFASGSDDYLVKPFAMEELKFRLLALVRRARRELSSLNVGDLSIDLEQHCVIRDGQPIKLSPVCWKILVCLMQNSPNVVSKKKLEEAGWGDGTPNANNLKVHLFKLRRAIDSPFENKLIHTIHGVGVALRD